MQSILLVGNPAAQSGKNAERLALARAAFEARGAPCEIFPTLPHGQTIAKLGARLAEGTDSMVVAMAWSFLKTALP